MESDVNTDVNGLNLRHERLRVEQGVVLKNQPIDAKNADFLAEKRRLAKRYTGATVALHWYCSELTDSETPNRHRICLSQGPVL